MLMGSFSKESRPKSSPGEKTERLHNVKQLLGDFLSTRRGDINLINVVSGPVLLIYKHMSQDTHQPLNLSRTPTCPESSLVPSSSTRILAV